MVRAMGDLSPYPCHSRGIRLTFVRPLCVPFVNKFSQGISWKKKRQAERNLWLLALPASLGTGLWDADLAKEDFAEQVLVVPWPSCDAGWEPVPRTS